MDETIPSTAFDPSSIANFTTNVVSAYVSHNSVAAAELPVLLSSVHAALLGLAAPSVSVEQPLEKLTPAQVRKSITPEALISFVDGKPYKTLKRHLSRNGMTFDHYLERYGLPRDYPATAPSYSARRSALAKSLGLGQRRGAVAKVAEVAEAITEPQARSRKKAADAPRAESLAKGRGSKKRAVVD